MKLNFNDQYNLSGQGRVCTSRSSNAQTGEEQASVRMFEQRCSRPVRIKQVFKGWGGLTNLISVLVGVQEQEKRGFKQCHCQDESRARRNCKLSEGKGLTQPNFIYFVLIGEEKAKRVFVILARAGYNRKRGTKPCRHASVRIERQASKQCQASSISK